MQSSPIGFAEFSVFVTLAWFLGQALYKTQAGLKLATLPQPSRAQIIGMNYNARLIFAVLRPAVFPFNNIL